MAQETPKHSFITKLGALLKRARPDSSVEVVANDDQASSDNLKPKRKPWEIVLVAFTAVLALVAIVLTLFFSVAHGSLSDISLAGLPIKATVSQASLQQQLNSALQNYKISFKYTDNSLKSFPLAATGITIDSAKSAANAKQIINHSLMQRLEWWRLIKIALVSKTDQATLTAFISNDATQIKLAPKDANLSIVNGVASLSQAAAGSGSTVTDAESAITQAVDNLKSTPLALKPLKLSASVTAEDLQASQSKAQTLLSQPVSFTIAGNNVVATANDIANWIELTPVPSSKTVDVTVDSGKILNYINQIAKLYIQPPRSRLVVDTSAGQQVLDPGANGIDVVNKDQVAASVAQQLLQDKGVKMDLPVQYSTAQTVEAQPYPKWIVVDVTTKRMYAYEQTNLVRTFLVSAGAPATPTVLGHYTIYAKYASQNMSGANADGSSYFQPNVPYVNYFYGGYAIHGNYWRPASYFGNINSSHGCVGVNVSDAAWMYNWAPIGTPVITHA